MSETKLYNAEEVIKILNISRWTLKNWYMWEKKLMEEGHERYLPVPIIEEHKKGRPNMWTAEMIEELKVYKENIVFGPHGAYGKYTNPLHKQTKKYKNQMEEA